MVLMVCGKDLTWRVEEQFVSCSGLDEWVLAAPFVVNHLACQGLSLDEIAWEPTRMENKDKHDVITFLCPTFVALSRQLFQ